MRLESQVARKRHLGSQSPKSRSRGFWVQERKRSNGVNSASCWKNEAGWRYRTGDQQLGRLWHHDGVTPGERCCHERGCLLMGRALLQERWLSPEELAEFTGHSVSTLAHWRCAGKGPAFLKVSHHVAYPAPDVEEWLRSRRVERKPVQVEIHADQSEKRFLALSVQNAREALHLNYARRQTRCGLVRARHHLGPLRILR